MNTRINSPRLSCAIGLACILPASILPVSILGGCDKGEAAGAASASKASTAAPEFVDTDFGFRATPPIDWQVASSQMVAVPGKVVKVWVTQGTRTIVAFTQEPGQPVSAGQLLSATVGPMTKIGCKVSFQSVVKVSGMDAMSVKLTGLGTGAGIGGGNVQTYQHWIAIPKGNRVLVLLLTAPDATKDGAAKAFEEMVQSVKVD